MNSGEVILAILVVIFIIYLGSTRIKYNRGYVEDISNDFWFKFRIRYHLYKNCPPLKQIRIIFKILSFPILILFSLMFLVSPVVALWEVAKNGLLSLIIFLACFCFLWPLLYYSYKSMLKYIFHYPVNFLRKMTKGNKKAKLCGDRHQEALELLAEGRKTLNQARAERIEDDSSPFNPPLTEEDAYWVIRRSVEAAEKEKQDHSKQDDKKK